MEHNEIELTLEGLSAARGEIAFNDLTAIIAPLQQLTMRIGRHMAGQDGPGHNTAAVDRSTELRLLAVTAGSTCLQIGFGESDVLIDHDIERRTADGLFEVWAACASGRPPVWVSPLIADTVAKLVDGLSAATAVSLGSASRPSITLLLQDIDRSPWNRAAAVVDGALTTMVGVLEMVDLASSSFRLLDAVGNKITLRQVARPEVAAGLIGQRVAATGRRITSSGRFRGLETPTVAAFELPQEWTAPSPVDLADLLSETPGPDPHGGADFSDDEFDAFMAAVRG